MSFIEVLGNTQVKDELKRLCFKSLGSGWYANDEGSIRLRLWKSSEIDFWRFRSEIDDDENELRFRGKIHNLDEIEWVLDRCFSDVIVNKEETQLTLPIVIEFLKGHLEVNAGRLSEPLLRVNKNPKDDAECHQAFLMLAHLKEIEDYCI